MGYNALSLSTCSRASCKGSRVIYLTSNSATRIASPQARGLWQYSYYRRESRSFGKWKQPQGNTWHIKSKLQDQASHPRRRSQSQSYWHHPWQKMGLGWGDTKSSISGNPSAFWKAHRTRTQQRIEQIKKEIEADPYKALFGQSLEPFNLGGNHSGILGLMIQSLLGRGQEPEPHTKSSDTATRKKTTERSSELRAGNSLTFTSSREGDTPGETPGKDVNLKYGFDPISGRMVPLKSKAFNETQPSQTAGNHGLADPSIKESETSIGNAGYPSSINHFHGPIEIEHQKGNKEPLESEDTHPLETINNPKNDDSHKQEGLGHLEEAVLNKMTRSHDQNLDSRGVIVDSHAEQRPEQTMQNTPTVCIVTSNISPDVSSLSRPLRDVEQSNSWITQLEMEEDLDILCASDIRATYALGVRNRKTNAQVRENRHNLEMAFKSYQDPIKDLDAQSIRAKYYPLSESTSPEHLPFSTPSGAAAQSSPETILPRTLILSQDAPKSIGSLGEQSHAIQAPRISPSSRTVDRLLIYIPWTMQIIETEAKFSLDTTDTPLSCVEVLSRLNHPDKFVPHIAKMDKHGFEIVSGGGDVIFFRQAVTDSSSRQSRPSNSRHIQEDIMAGSPSSSSLLSHLSVSGQTPSDDRFNSNTSSRARTVLRGILIGSTVTIATCYAIGVVAEYFRTGGQDGFGIDGFTEFESERRHRDRQ